MTKIFIIFLVVSKNPAIEKKRRPVQSKNAINWGGGQNSDKELSKKKRKMKEMDRLWVRELKADGKNDRSIANI